MQLISLTLLSSLSITSYGILAMARRQIVGYYYGDFRHELDSIRIKNQGIQFTQLIYIMRNGAFI